MGKIQLFAGIDLGGTSIKMGLCRRDGGIVFSDTVASNVDLGPDKLLTRLGDCALVLLEKSRKMGGEIRHIGVGTPGTVDPEEGRVVGISPNIPGWEGAEIRKSIERRAGVRVFVDNDVNVTAVAEHRFGATQGFSDVLAVTVGTGIGGGIIVGGSLYRGSIGAAGEIGHITVKRGGRKCNCGRRGCLEQYAAMGSYLRFASEAARKAPGNSLLHGIIMAGKRITLKDLFRAFTKGDKAAVAAVESAAGFLANGLASACALLNPQIIVIGGGVVDGGGEKLIRIIRREVKVELFPPLDTTIEIRRAKLGNRAGIVGAAFLGE